ncbi:helix-turn-helix domain-containing protein [Streptomyces sp. DH10]|uniref:helix-turn-helix domain-containing protein n=1 Tax=Streptomyces sp. DH10 TaxID=3040121 RepID=UPI003FA7BC06
MRGSDQRFPSVQFGTLQSWLLDEKRRSGLSFGELAARTFVSKSALHRATRGSRLPSRQIFDAFVAGCKSDPEAAEEQWRWAELVANAPDFPWGYSNDGPEAVANYSDLRQALLWLTAKSGRSLRELESVARAQGGRLRRSTVSDALRGRHNFSRWMVAELVRACGVSSDAVTAWDEAWQRAERERRGRRGHLGAVRRLPAEAREVIELGVVEMFRIGDRYGIPDAEIELYIRGCAERKRRWKGGTYWAEPPESWKRAVQGPLAGLSRRLEEALSPVLAVDDEPSEDVVARVIQVVIGVISDSGERALMPPTGDTGQG